MDVNGYIAGYDPGGNGRHGLAVGEYEDGVCKRLVTCTKHDAESVIRHLEESYPDLLAIGVDTLVHWAAGPSGWRPADRWLRKRYPPVQSSVIPANSLYGSATVNGMAVILSLTGKRPDLCVTETHPKVLYYALSGEKYGYDTNSKKMERDLSDWLRYEVNTDNDHEFDAALSVYAAYEGLCGDWTHDLLNDPRNDADRLVCPVTPAHYWWPE